MFFSPPRFRPAIAVALLAFACAGGAAQAANPAGYMLLDSLTESFEQSGNVVILAGTITNQCSAPLPQGSALEFAFDGIAFTGFQITALSGGSQQQFSAYGALPQNLPQPRRNVTSLDFTIVLPKTRRDVPGEAKTSQCLVTFAAGSPPR
jgi:hypothetical protein